MAKQGRIAGSKAALRDRAKRRKREEKFGSRKIKRRFLLVSEGQETEPNYFIEFKKELHRDIVIIPKGTGKNTLGVVKRAELEKETLRLSGQEPDETWVLFDKDDFPAHKFDNAIARAEAKGFHAGWSNECFELWILLHFEDIQRALPRKEIFTKLSNIFGFNYYKEGKGKNTFQLIRKHQGDEAKATERAKALWDDSNRPFSQANPMIAIYKLIEKLIEYRLNP